jgi:hypothetical protein
LALDTTRESDWAKILPLKNKRSSAGNIKNFIITNKSSKLPKLIK